MAKKDIQSLISSASKGNTKPVVQKQTVQGKIIPKQKTGRPNDYPEDIEVRRITVKLEESTIEALRVQLATKYKDYTQNTLVNKLLKDSLNV